MKSFAQHLAETAAKTNPVDPSTPVHGHYAIVGVGDTTADIVFSRHSDAIGLEHGKFRGGNYRTIARTPKLPKALDGKPATVGVFSGVVVQRYRLEGIRSARII